MSKTPPREGQALFGGVVGWWRCGVVVVENIGMTHGHVSQACFTDT